LYDRWPRQQRRDAIEPPSPYRLGSLADLVGLILDGWQVEHLHYADACRLEGARGGPAAFVVLARGDGREHIYIVEDGRAMSHRSLVAQFRDHPHIWKRRSTGMHELAATVPAAPPMAPEEWGEVPDAFPDSLDLSPAALRGVLAVNQTQSVDDVTVTITSLERFEQGARLHYLCHAPMARAREELGALDVIAVDDIGRLYRVAPCGRTQRGNRIVGTLAVAPGIPASARALTVTIGTLGHDGSGAALPGPWVFPIPLE
jgi:hypothetical protein